jgi:hypothetical protein
VSGEPGVPGEIGEPGEIDTTEQIGEAGTKDKAALAAKTWNQ